MSEEELKQMAKQTWWNRVVCLFKGHDLLAWEEPCGPMLIIEYWECDRCGEFLGVGDVKEQ
jgi:hypothetical protein